MELNWKIEWMRTTPTVSTPPSRVLECGWRCTGAEGKFSASIYDSYRFEPTNDDGTFVPYEQLTQDAVLSWCWGGGVDKGKIEGAIAAQIEAQKNPPTVLPALPWA